MSCPVCGSTINKSGHCSGDKIDQWAKDRYGFEVSHQLAELLHFVKGRTGYISSSLDTYEQVC